MVNTEVLFYVPVFLINQVCKRTTESIQRWQITGDVERESWTTSYSYRKLQFQIANYEDIR